MPRINPPKRNLAFETFYMPKSAFLFGKMTSVSTLYSIAIEWILWRYAWKIRTGSLTRLCIGCEALLGERFSPCLFVAYLFKRLRRLSIKIRHKESSRMGKARTRMTGSGEDLAIDTWKIVAAVGHLCLEGGATVATSMIPISWAWKLVAAAFIINFIGLWLNTGNYQSIQGLKGGVNWRISEMWWAFDPTSQSSEARARHEEYASGQWVKTYVQTMIELEAQVPKIPAIQSRRERKSRRTQRGRHAKPSVRCAGCGKCLKA